MNSLLRIALVGDYNPDVVAHKAIPWRLMMPPPYWSCRCVMTGWLPAK